MGAAGVSVFTGALHNAQQGYQLIQSAWQACKPLLLAGQRLCISIKPETRTTAQNRLLWSVLTDLAEQCEWAVDGAMVKLTTSLPPRPVERSSSRW